MCGISAIASHKQVASKLLNTLLNLEYRGYDSCGMSIYDGVQIQHKKNIGNVNEVNHKVDFLSMKGSTGIAHTRWATHGGVTMENSHPHPSNDNNFAIVHNGIFSNYQDLKEELIQKGYLFKSTTDTEVFSNLLQDEYRKSQNIEDAFCESLKKIEGSYAIAMITNYNPGVIYAVKKDSPLVIGVNDGTNYISSDINAFISETKDTILLGDFEYVIMTKDSYEVKKLSNRNKILKEVIKVKWDRETARRGGFSHYMLKEIFDQPQTIRNALQIQTDQLEEIARKFINKEQSFCVGVGTTYYIAMIGTYLFSKFANMYVPAISSDEYPNLIPVKKDHHVLFLSQSGETYDTRMAIRAAKNCGASTSAIVNVVGSSISQTVDHCIYQQSGPEICVVSTKAALSQIIILWQVALRVGVLRNKLTQKEADAFHDHLHEFAEIIEKVLNEESGFIRGLAMETSNINNWLFMGKGIYYPIALESALKMKEVTYLHAEGLPSGFLKHGTLAMVDENLYSLFFLPSREKTHLFESTLMAIEEVKTRKGKVVSFCLEDDTKTKELLDYYFVIPKIHSELTPLIELVMAQLFSYYSALHLGLNIDKPRNLAKSVTVG
ncbi:MAG: glutamine--fructose-6-phosphate transaminase (isomerizing) [Deltaproteobacteria bacterium]|nr:glutamine--fructose-6-phosphate transaminase (isomerizing) [Deltaproteobacteria bacterium]